MASFLEKLIGGDDEVNNNTSPDASGVITRRLIKAYAAQPPEALGLILSDDCEVIGVDPSSLAESAKITPHFMIFEVNGTFIEDSKTFFDSCRCDLTLIIKLQAVNGMSELIAKFLQMDEQSTNTPEAQRELYDSMQLSPRFNFLSSEHPFFRRFNRRLQEKREANALIKQRAEESKEEDKRQLLEHMQKLKDDHAAPPKTTVEDQIVHQGVNPEIDDDSGSPFVDIYTENKSSFFGNKCSPEPEADLTPQTEIVSNQELLALVGVESEPPSNQPVSYVILPSEEYILRTGEKAVHSLKKRIGPPPVPPPA